MDRPEVVVGLVVAFLIVFVLFWSAIVFLLSLAGGWWALGKRYAAKDMEFAGQRWETESGAMRVIVSYNHILTIGANTLGLYLSVLAFFRPGHPPLFIPWEHIEMREKQGLFRRTIVFAFTQVPGTTLTVSQSLGAQIAAAAQRPV